MNRTSFSVPETLTPYIDNNLHEAHAELTNVTVDEFWNEMPRSQMPRDDSLAEFVDLRPEEDHDSDKVVVLPLPFANGWAPHMALRARLLQRCMDEPMRIIVLPNDRKSYHLTSEENSYVAGGNFEPLATKQLNTLQLLKVEQVSYVGYSQGATLGASALRLAALRDQFILGSSGLFEPPNIIERKPRKLQRQFIDSGKNLNTAVNDANIAALSETQHSRGGFDSVIKNLGLLPFVLKTQSATNRAIHKGFSHPYFSNDVSAALKRNRDMHLMVVAGEESSITPADSIRTLVSSVSEGSRSRLTTRFVEGYGHEMGDNIVVHALLGRLALDNC